MPFSAQNEASLLLNQNKELIETRNRSTETRNKNREFIKAKDYAYRLLSYRQRSRQEIEQRLKKKKFTPGVIKKTIAYLSEINYINDEDFARCWIRSKIESNPCGWSLLRYQLRQKGIAEQIIARVISSFSAQYDEIDVAKRLLSSRRTRCKGLEPLKLKKRLYDYLCRRGFSQEAISEAIK